MRFKHSKQIIVCAICLLMAISLCACKPKLDQNFINLNTATQPTTPSLTEPNTQPSTTEPTTQPTEESKPSFKPGGLVLPDETTSPTPETKPTEPPTTQSTEPTTSTPVGGHISGIKISSGLKAALNSLGKTTYGKVTALQPVTGADGSHTIINIQNNGTTAQQYVYMYYESADDYTKASNGVSKDSCNDKFRLILRGESEVLPVTNPETMGIVLFDGYLLWR